MNKLLVRFYNVTKDRYDAEASNNIVSALWGILDRGDLSDTIAWGIYSNTGSISVIDDSYQNLKYYVFNDDNFPKNEYKIEFYLSNNNSQTLIGTFYIKDYSYNENTRQIDIELSDNLDALQNKDIDIRITGEDAFKYRSQSLYDLCNKYLEDCGVSITSGVKQLLQETNVGYGYRYENISAWSFLTEICNLAEGRIFVDENGEPTLRKFTRRTDPIIIPARDIFEIVPVCSRHNSCIKSVHVATKTPHFSKQPIISPQTISFIPPASDDESDYIVDITADTITVRSKAKVDIPISEEIIDTSQSLEWDVKTKYTENQVEEVNVRLNLSKKTANDIFISTKIKTGLISLVYELVYGIRAYCLKYGEDVEHDTDFNDINVGRSISIPTSIWLQEGSFRNHLTPDIYFSGLIHEFNEGLECIEISCAIDDYKNDVGFVVINGKDENKKLGKFSIYSIVIPYVIRKGISVPYKVNSVGKPQTFRILGIKYNYDGHLTQRLYLQEYYYSDFSP